MIQFGVQAGRLGDSEQIGLFHDSDELFFADFAVAVSVGLIYHFL